jgi:hypothetical protein
MFFSEKRVLACFEAYFGQYRKSVLACFDLPNLK